MGCTSVHLANCPIVTSALAWSTVNFFSVSVILSFCSQQALHDDPKHVPFVKFVMSFQGTKHDVYIVAQHC